MRQGRNLVSNSDFNRKRIRSKEHIEGGEEYLKSSYGRFADGSNASVLISSSFASENIVGGGQLRSNNYSASSRSIKGKRAYAHFKGGEGNYTSLMSSDFAGTETMLNPGNASFWNVDVSSRSDHIVGGGAKSTGSVSFWNASRACVLGFIFKKGGKPFSRTLRSNIRRLVPQEFGRELYANVLASLWTRNDFSMEGGGGHLISAISFFGGAILC